MKTVSEDLDEQYGQHSNVGDALRRQEKQAGSAANLEDMYKAPSVTEQDRQRNQPNDKRPKRWQLLTSKKIRGKSSLFAVLLVLFGGGGFVTIFMSPSLAIVQLRQVLTEDLNDQLAAFDKRSAMMLRAKLKDVTTGSCGAVKIKCKFATVSTKQVKKFAQQGIFVETEKTLLGRNRAKSFTFVDQDTGAREVAHTAEDLHRITTGSAARAAQMTKAYNSVFVSLSDRVALSTLRGLGTSKSSKLNGNSDEERRQSLNTAIGEGEKIDPKLLTPEVDEDGKQTGRLIGPDGLPMTQQQIDDLNSSGTLAEQAGKIKPSKIITSIGKGVMITGIIDSACTVANSIRLVGSLSKTEKLEQGARFVQAALLGPADELMANDGTEAKATYVGNFISNIGGPVPDEKIVDESKIGLAGSATNVPMINNPDIYATAFDSPGVKTALHDDAPTLDTRAARFSLAGGFIGTLSKVSQYMAVAITGDPNADPQVISERCKFVQNPYVRGTALVAGIFVGIGSFGLAQAAGISGSLMISMALPYALAMLADISSGHVFKDLYGKDFGDGSFVGTSGILGEMAKHRALKPLSASEAMAYTKQTQETYAQYAKTQRYIARSEPFNIYNQYSFMGSIAATITPLAYQGGSSVSTMAMSTLSLIPASFASLTGTAKADSNIERFQKCEDPVYRKLNIDADIFCNVRYGLSDQEMSLDPIDNAQWMADSGNIDPDSETGEAKDNGASWNYQKFLAECVNRTAGWGEDQTENEGDGSNCIKPENEELNKHFRVYTLDKSVSEAMDGETGEGQLPGTSGYGTGEKGAVAADGWAYPTVKEAIISNGGHYMEPSRGVHRGVDLITPDGPANKPIFAARDGVVVTAGPEQGFGNWIIIRHNIDGKTVDTIYGHMEDDGVLVKLGDTVRAGQQIGRIGNKGDSTGAHLHFEIWEGGRFEGRDVDPTPIIERAKAGS